WVPTHDGTSGPDAVLDAASQSVPARLEAPCHLHASCDAPGVRELDAPLGWKEALAGLPGNRDPAATGAHRKAPLAVGAWQAADVAVVRQSFRPALDLAGQRVDPLQGGVDPQLETAPHGRRTCARKSGERASLAGRQSPSAEPRRTAASGRAARRRRV